MSMRSLIVCVSKCVSYSCYRKTTEQRSRALFPPSLWGQAALNITSVNIKKTALPLWRLVGDVKKHPLLNLLFRAVVSFCRNIDKYTVNLCSTVIVKHFFRYTWIGLQFNLNQSSGSQNSTDRLNSLLLHNIWHIICQWHFSWYHNLLVNKISRRFWTIADCIIADKVIWKCPTSPVLPSPTALQSLLKWEKNTLQNKFMSVCYSWYRRCSGCPSMTTCTCWKNTSQTFQKLMSY